MDITLKERDRRYAAVRNLMKERALDVLLVYGGGEHFGVGNARYLTNIWNGTGDHFCIFPGEGEPTVITSWFPGLPKVRRGSWIKDYAVTTDQLQEAAERLAPFSAEKIGTVGIEKGSHAYYRVHELPFSHKSQDATGIFRELRLVKSREEIEQIRRAAFIADSVYHGIQNLIKPGVNDFTIFGKVRQIEYELESEKSFELIDCDGALMNHLYPTGDVLQTGGTMGIEISPCYRGYYAQLPVTIPVGEPLADLAAMLRVWQEAIDAGAKALRPGALVRDVFNAMDRVVRGKGYAMLARAGHALGLDLIDFFSVTDAEETVLRENMTLVLHPSVQAGGREDDGIFMGCTFLVTKTGGENLSKVHFDFIR
jgi:Xaa-Pro aminopeptidase